MKRLLFLGMLVMLAFMFVGCSTTSVERFELLVVTNNPVGSKVGEASVMPVWKFGKEPAESTGEHGGIYQAAKNAGITKISIVELKRVTGVIDKYSIVVYGE